MNPIPIIIMALLFGLMIGANHLIVNRLIKGEQLNDAYDYNLFILMFLYIISLAYIYDSKWNND